MKSLIILIALFLVACSSLMNGGNTTQPVLVKDAKQQIMFTTCSGVVEDWGSCSRKAGKACANGYEVIKRDEDIVGAKRELTFKCN
jgi:hypothetical protein